MRTSLNSVKAIDDYLSGHMSAGDALVFEANLLINTHLTAQTGYQKAAYAMIRQYSRQQLKAEIKAAQHALSDSFMQRISRFFKKR